MQKVIEIISQAYSLYNNELITADDLVIILPYVLVQAKIDRLLSHYNFIMAFHYSVDTGDKISVIQTNLNIAVNRLKGTDFDDEIRKHDPSFFENQKPQEFSLEKEAHDKVGGSGLRRMDNKKYKTNLSPIPSPQSSPTAEERKEM